MKELRACLPVSGIFLLAALFRAAPPVHAQGDASRATPPPGTASVIAGAPRAQPPAPVAAPPPVAAAPRAQPSPPRPAPSPEPGGDWSFALIAKGGGFKLANANQTVAGLASTFDTTSKPAVGIEAELRHRAGFALGGEVFYYRNDLVATGVIAKQQVVALMANAKYYLRVADWFHPFVGVGVGAANAVYSGDLKGTAGGAAYQGMAGMEFRFENVGVLVQYKHLAATTGKSGSDVKIGGSGVLAGVSIAF